MAQKKTTEFFAFYPKAFLTDTTDLDAEEIGFYLLLLLYQWEHGHIPDDISRAAKICRSVAPISAMNFTCNAYALHMQNESNADANLMHSSCRKIAYVLKKHFSLDGNGWKNDRMEHEKEVAIAKTNARISAASKRWSKNQENVSNKNEDAMHMQCMSNAYESIEYRVKSIKRDSINTISVDSAENGEEEKPKRKRKAPEHPPCPQKEIIALYHELLPSNPPVVESLWKGSQAEKRLRDRWQQAPEHQSMDYWQWFFTGVAAIPFYAGQNGSGWKADLGWLLRPEKFREMVARLVGAGDGSN